MALSNVGIKFSVQAEGLNILRDMNRETASFHQSLRNLGSVGVAGFALREIYQLGKQVASAAMEAQDKELFFARTMQDNLPAASRAAEELSEKFGDTRDNIQQMMATGMGLARTLDIDQAKSLEMAKGVAQMSYQFAHFWSISPAEAFAAMESGLTGNSKALKRYGIDVSDTAVQQFALNKGWIEQDDVLSAAGEAYIRLKIEQEAVNKLTETQTGGVKSLREEWREFSGHLKANVEPAMVGTANGLAKMLAGVNAYQDAWKKAGKPTENAGPGFMGVGTMANLYSNLPMPGGPKIESGGSSQTQIHSPPMFPTPEMVNADRLRRLQPLSDSLSLFYGYDDKPAGILDEAKTAENRRNAEAEEKRKQKRAEDEAAALASRQLHAQESMLKGMNKNDQQYWYLRKQLIGEDYEQYSKIFNRETQLMEDWKKRQEELLGREQAYFGNDFGKGFAARTAEMKEELWSLGKAGAETATMLRDGFADAWTDALFEGKDFGDQIKAMLRDIAKEMFRQMVARQITTQAVNWGQVAATSIAGAFASGGSGVVAASATGNVFGPSGRIRAFADGGLTTGPTYFRDAAGGNNVMGEKGTEGVLPLDRGPDNKLGVRAYGGRSEKLLEQILGALQSRSSGPAVIDEESLNAWARSKSGIREIVTVVRRNG
jgi:hypothetical protein